MEERNKLDTQETQEDTLDAAKEAGVNQLYEPFRKIPLRYLDAFIVICVLALIAVLAMGLANR